MTDVTPHWNSSNRGGYLIYDPRKPMTPQERAAQMWRVHPVDIKYLGFATREEFYLAHMLQASAEAAAAERMACVTIVKDRNNGAYHMPWPGGSVEWVNGFHTACVGIEEDILARYAQASP